MIPATVQSSTLVLAAGRVARNVQEAFRISATRVRDIGPQEEDEE